MPRWSQIGRVWMAALLLVLPTISQQATPAHAAATPSVADARLFTGVNVPWFNWACDFGCGASKGVSSPAVRSALGDQFAQLQASGVHTVRWWVFEGDAW